MSALSLRLPDSIPRHIKAIAEREGMSINQFISTAVSEKISAFLAEEYLMKRAKQAKKRGLSGKYSTRCQTGRLWEAT